MAETSYPWSPPSAGASIGDDQYRVMSRTLGLRVPGVLTDDLNACAPSAGSGAVNVASGMVGAFGHLYQNSASLALTVPNNATGATRYDAVVVRFNFTGKTAAATYLTGNASTAGPTLAADMNGNYDVLIARVAVTTGNALTVSDARHFAQGYALGLIAPPKNVTADQGGITSTPTDLTGASYTFTALAGHRYRHTVAAYVSNTVTDGDIGLDICDGGGGSVYHAGTKAPQAADIVTLSFTWWETIGATGSITRKLRMVAPSGTCAHHGSLSPLQYSIEDMG